MQGRNVAQTRSSRWTDPQPPRKVPAAIAVGTALLLTLVLAAAAPATAADDKGVPGLENSASLTSAVVLDGRLARTDGTPVAGTEVVLYAWPSADVLAKMATGEVVKKAPVGFATTAASGGFILRVSDHTLLSRYKNSDGVVNLEAVAASSDGLFSYSFTTDSAASAKSGSVASAAGGTSNVVLMPARDLAPRIDQPQLPADLRAADKACSTVKVANIGNFWVTVGYGYVSGSGATMTFSYTSGASSSLGVGLSTSGANGTYSASGTASVSSSSTVGYPSTGSFKAWQTQFMYGKFRTICTEGSLVVADYYNARPVSFSGGAQVTTIAGAPTATYCTSYVAGSTFTKSSTDAYNASGGVSSSGLLGVNLSAKTGYSTTAKLAFKFTTAKQLCGTNGYPGASPSRLVAK